MESQEFTRQQYRKFNGQSIMLALSTMGGLATADELAEHIGSSIDQPSHIVKPEVSQVLRRGISNGFFQRRGKKYCLYNEGSTYQVDSRKRKLNLIMETDGGKKRSRVRNDDNDDEKLQSEADEETIEGLQEIISKANEETHKAAILATRAAERAKSAIMKIQEITRETDGASDE